jgi:pimeloyl-ACP methyl ester carboxylesterase
MERVVVTGLDVAFQRQGEGPNLILLHGGMCDSRVWRMALEAFSDTFTVVAWDAPGCGQSSDPPEEFRLPEFADCLGRFIDSLGVQRPHILGHSWGAALALELYRQRPEMVRSLVLAGAYAGWAGSLPSHEVDQRLQFALRAAEKVPGFFEPTSMSGLFSDVLPTDTAAELITIMSETRAAGIRTMAYSLAEADLRDVLPHIDVPTLLLYGDADQRSPLNVAKELHARIPQAILTVLPGLGHESYLESPETFSAEVLNFLANCRT